MTSFDKFKPFIRQAGHTVGSYIVQNGLSVQSLVFLYKLFVEQLVPFDSSEIDCSAGCGYCCHLKVTASPAELIIILNFVQKEGIAEDFLHNIAGTSDRILQRGAKDDSWWAANCVPCIFFDTGTQLCRIYEVRPFTCRGYHSLDMELCRTGSERNQLINIPCFPDLKRSREMYSISFCRALRDLGLQAPLLEVSSAAALLLQQPELVDSWFGGQQVFR